MAVIEATNNSETSSGCCGSSAPPRITLADKARSIIREAGVPVWGMAAIMLVLVVMTETQASASALFTFDAFVGILPFILASVLIAAGLKAAGADNMVASAFTAHPATAIFTASLFGALSPFCSCGVVPLVAGLLVAGVPIAPVLAFCIASPIMDPEMFILTAAGLGIEFAMVKTLAAVGMGVFAGFVAQSMPSAGLLDDVLKPIARPSCCASGTPKASKTQAPPVWSFWTDATRRTTFREASVGNFVFLGRWLAFAFLLESLMVAYVPDTLVASWLGSGNAWAMPLAVLVGVPAYLNGYAAIPLVSGLIDLGMSPATGMAFMLAGSVTSIPAAIAIWSLAKMRLFALYLGVAGAGALMAAASWQAVL